MKKVLFMAMAAVALMACNGNGGGNTPSKNVPEADKKAYTAASADLMALVGKDVAQTEKALTDAGYVKVEMEAGVAGALAPAKYKIPAAQKAAIEESLFFYNFPENVAEMDEQEGKKYLDSLIAAGKGYAMAYVYSYQNTMVLVESIACLAITADANKMFAGISEKVYAGMPQTAIQKYYNGSNVIAKDTTKFETNQAFVEAIAKIDGAVIASEMAIAVTSQQYDGLAFLDSWVNPDDATKEAMKGKGFTPFINASFLLGDFQMVNSYLEEQMEEQNN